ncbi:MAG: 5-(carboxyamino)imidazole ribonucleotide mutase [Bdellovibrionales bacterium]|nr:5-(carboxyamino)imidazole ribonucleotide mutase [Bdellovibrionales bacterium]
MKAKVGIIMGSQSDARIMKAAAEVLRDFKIPFEMKVVSAHRTPEYMQEYALQAEERGLQVIIAGAGGAAHLPGMVASLTPLPVIGVPVAVNRTNGLDSLLSIAQMPKGVPVATTAIDNAHNAGLLAARILALSDLKLRKALHQHRSKMKTKVKKSQSLLKKYLR